MPLVRDVLPEVTFSSIEEAAPRCHRSTSTSSNARAILIACFALTHLAACSEQRRGPTGDDSSSVSSSKPTEASSAPLTSSAQAAVSAAAPKASAEEAPQVSGTWEGTYHAKKGSVDMPPKVKDAIRAADDGK